MYAIYANIGGILMVNVTIYIAYMDPMGYDPIGTCTRCPFSIPHWTSRDQTATNIPSGYDEQFAMERSTIFKVGKPSISMGHGFHGCVK